MPDSACRRLHHQPQLQCALVPQGLGTCPSAQVHLRTNVPSPCSRPAASGGGRANDGKQQQQQGGSAADGWSHRDTMLKPWQDLVTHRLLLRAEEQQGGSGGKGGLARGQPPVRLARWLLPDDPTVIPFRVSDSGIHLC